ncbi:UNVERIFIED_CONTAM: hypothetical protein FKN15_034927 [Acipenser sinensis]
MVGLKPSDVPPTPGVKFLSAGTAACIADLFTFPLDTAKVRLQVTLHLEHQSPIHAAYEGAGTLPNITRNAIVNATELVTYDIIKETILKYKLLTDNLPCHFFSAFGAGFCTTVVASPVDVVKTRYMNSPLGQYKSAINCAWTMFTKEGPTAFYKGFVPSFLRMGSWNVVMFVSFEQLKRAMMMSKQSLEGTA